MKESLPIETSGTSPASGSKAKVQTTLPKKSLAISPESPGLRALRRFLRHRPATISAIILILLVLTAIAAPLIQRYPRDATDLRNREIPPDGQHWFGTDRIGRDVWSRTIHGARVSLALGVSVALLTGILGATLGVLSGFLGGVVDIVIMRIVDLMMTIPSILILLVVVTYVGVGAGITNLMIILPLMSWMGSCRLMRGQVLQVREMDFVMAARCLGFGNLFIMLRHILPNAFTPILVSITMSIGGVILTEAGLSFLGLGVMPPTPTWGNMMREANNIEVLQNMPWIWLPPAVLITVTTLCVNFVGDGLRDAFDPRQIM